MRLFRYLILGALLLALLVVALANRTAVAVQLLPDDFAVLIGWQARAQVPLFVVLGLGAVIGVVIGFVWEWLREHKIRSTATRATRKATRLEGEVERLRERAQGPKDEVLALLEKPGR